MKLSEAVLLSAPAFKEVYKLYNFKDDDSLKDYCDLVIHEPVEWMRGFPAAWKSVSTFSKPRSAFHKLMKEPSVIEALGVEYCENVHNVVWKAFKEHMSEILEKRSGSTIQSPALRITCLVRYASPKPPQKVVLLILCSSVPTRRCALPM